MPESNSGTGILLKASEIQTGQIVAFKRFHSNLADDAGALSTLHAAKIIHRNIKPSNVLLFEGGGTKLSDMGTANVKCRGLIKQ